MIFIFYLYHKRTTKVNIFFLKTINCFFFTYIADKYREIYFCFFYEDYFKR